MWSVSLASRSIKSCCDNSSGSRRGIAPMHTRNRSILGFLSPLQHTTHTHHVKTHTHTHTHTFNGLFSGTTQVSWYQKGKPIWILLKQETVSSRGNSWAICKSAHCSRQITMPAPHHSVFYRLDALPAAYSIKALKATHTLLYMTHHAVHT